MGRSSHILDPISVWELWLVWLKTLRGLPLMRQAVLCARSLRNFDDGQSCRFFSDCKSSSPQSLSRDLLDWLETLGPEPCATCTSSQPNRNHPLTP